MSKMNKFDCNALIFYVNGRRVEDKNVDPRTTLAVYLRDFLNLKGTKIGCNEGGCGACTVMISEISAGTGEIRHFSANACLMPVCAVFGKAVTTVEGIGSAVENRMHPVQERLSKAHGSQCGFCTPGFVMAMYSLLRNKPKPTEEDINEALQGNLCRCTGYRPILEAFYSFATKDDGTVKASEKNGCPMGENCCKNKSYSDSKLCVPKDKLSKKLSNGNYTHAINSQTRITLEKMEDDIYQRNKKVIPAEYFQKGTEARTRSGSDKENSTDGSQAVERKQKLNLTDLSGCDEYDPSQELIFPPELKMERFGEKSFSLEHPESTWFQPTDFATLLSLKESYPHARIISGNSEVAVELKFRFIDLKTVINPRQVSELRVARLDQNKGAFIGTGLSLTEMDQTLKQYSSRLHHYQTEVFRAVSEMLHWFAGKHVRNVASVAGNIATASPISDLNPIWMAAGAEIILASKSRGERKVAINENFFLGYRRTVIEPDEVIKAIWVPLTKENEIFRGYKQAQRREDDIAIVTGAFFVRLNPANFVVEEIRISYGGMAPTTKMALNTMKTLTGMKWTQELLDKAFTSLSDEFKLPPGVPGGMPRYRLGLTLSFFFKFFLEVARIYNITEISDRLQVTDIGLEIPKQLKASQVYQEVPSTQSEVDPVGRAIPHVAGTRHATGEAVYTGDMNVANCLHMALVLSPVASGKLISVDASEALSMENVVDFVDSNDIYTGARLGHHSDSELFAKEKVVYHCQPIGAIIAKDHETARRAANKVRVKIEPTKPIVTIEESIEANSYLLNPFILHSSLNEGDTVKVSDWSSYRDVVRGEIRMGGQEHFYLETQQCVAIPLEENEIEIHCSTQGVNDVQIEVAKMLGIPMHKVIVKVKRIGGGFGGKESFGAHIASMAALAAKKLKTPVRLTLERFDDMAITGTRHPFRGNYKVAIDRKTKKLLDMDVQLYANCGHSLDLSVGVIHRAMAHVDNVYKFANADIEGYSCKTNLASNTAYRGFGGPQGMFVTETIMVQASEELGIDVNELREANLYEEGDCTPFGMHLRQCNIRRTWDECKENSHYNERLKSVQAFNRANKYRKRGIFMTPTKFGIGFGLKQLNQAGALVLVYTDGTVLVNHGGMEMGQGLHTKMLQVAARCLNIPIEKIHIQETATDKVPNASPTAASVGSDLNGVAVKDACDQIMKRLEPIKQKNPNGAWEEWVKEAYIQRIQLHAAGFGIIHSESIDFLNGKGAEAFGYCVYGTACTEVEVDCLTGDHHMLRTDIVMDIGDSLNPAIDIGQIEGAFAQGYGLFTMEEIRIRPDGTRLTRGPGNYKIPSADDAPREMHVALLRGSSNKMAIFSSKAVGEPPLFLGSSALFAVREAVKAFREERGLNGYFRFDSPATPERIRIACEDRILEQVPRLPDVETYTPWLTEP